MIAPQPPTSRLRPGRRTAAGLGLLGLTVTGLLAGCSATVETGTSGGSGSGSSDDSGGSSSGSSSSSATFKDGTYSASGDYQSPGGQETIEVEVTLADSKVTKVTVTPQASGGNAEQYQKAFASGISDQVVGKRIDELDGVSKVSGSSLTSGGFQKAIADIEQQAES